MESKSRQKGKQSQKRTAFHHKPPKCNLDIIIQKKWAYSTNRGIWTPVDGVWPSLCPNLYKSNEYPQKTKKEHSSHPSRATSRLVIDETVTMTTQGSGTTTEERTPNYNILWFVEQRNELRSSTESLLFWRDQSIERDTYVLFCKHSSYWHHQKCTTNDKVPRQHTSWIMI